MTLIDINQQETLQQILAQEWEPDDRAVWVDILKPSDTDHAVTYDIISKHVWYRCSSHCLKSSTFYILKMIKKKYLIFL